MLSMRRVAASSGVSGRNAPSRLSPARQPASRECPGTSGRRPSTTRGGIGSLHCALQGVSVGSFESHLGFASLPGATVTYRPAVKSNATDGSFSFCFLSL